MVANAYLKWTILAKAKPSDLPEIALETLLNYRDIRNDASRLWGDTIWQQELLFEDIPPPPSILPQLEVFSANDS